MPTMPEPEIYTPERIAEFLLNNAICVEDWDAAADEVRELGLDPATVPNTDPEAREKLMSGREFDAKFDRIDRIEALQARRSA
jgi:hypothetical protein